MLNILVEHLKTHGCITSWEAFETYGCTRLSHYIYLMRTRLGMHVESQIVSGKNRFGHRTHYAKYVLKDVKDVAK